MKKKSPFKKAAVGAVGVAALWYALGALGILVIKVPGVYQKPIVIISIVDDELTISDPPGQSASCTPPAKGCVHVSKWKKAKIEFRLQNMSDWAFSKMQLVAEPTPKLDFGIQAGFTQDMIDDFYVKINGTKVHPDTNGIIDLSGLTNGDKFKLIDLNDFTQTYSYQVQACDTSIVPNECKETDPKIVNEG